MRKFITLAGILAAVLIVGTLMAIFEIQKNWKGWLYVAYTKIYQRFLSGRSYFIGMPLRVVSLFQHVRGLSFKQLFKRKITTDYPRAESNTRS